MRREGYGAHYEYDYDSRDAFSGRNYWPEALGPPSKLFQAGAKDFQILCLESPNISKDSFGGFEGFQGVTGAARPIFESPNFFAAFRRRTPPVRSRGAAGSAERLDLKTSAYPVFQK
jgi:hypothetical protein